MPRPERAPDADYQERDCVDRFSQGDLFRVPPLARQVGNSCGAYGPEKVEVGDLPDRVLWEMARSGDGGAFGVLFERHGRRIYNYCFRRTASWSLAEDAVQATFATLWRRAVAGKVDELGLESARPILLAMARGECSNANRSRGRQVRLVDRVGGATSGAADNTAEWVEAETTMQAIRQAMSVLPTHQRDVVELVAWSGLSMTEAAATLNISVGTVKSRLSRARTHLANTPIASLLGESR